MAMAGQAEDTEKKGQDEPPSKRLAGLVGISASLKLAKVIDVRIMENRKDVTIGKAFHSYSSTC